MMNNYEKQLEDIKKYQKFTIPVEIYNNKKYNVQRRNILLLLASIFEKNIDFLKLNYKDKVNIIVSIESSCYNETIKKADEEMIYKDWENFKFIYLYQLYCNKVTKNLDIESEVNNSYLIYKVINKEIDINKLASISSDILCPDKSLNIKQKIEIRNQQKISLKTSKLYVCRNCGHKECILKESQLKSLDEGTNLSVTCVFCGFYWIVG